ncbi:MAG: hemerythrin family protein [Oligoflexia bacterium]|nr:hemerythrin family protein [Oligoflexia bacterium]
MKDIKPFEWTSELELGVLSMDDQHKVIIEKINVLIEGLNKDESFSIRSAFDELCKYTVFHFDEEEKYMASISFPGLETHKLIHKNLLERMGELSSEIDSGELDKSGLVSFLKMWLRSHIKGIDNKYGVYSNSNAA